MIISLRKYMQGKGFRIFLYIMIATVGGVYTFLEMVRQYFVTKKDWAVQVNGHKISSGYLARKVQQQKLYIRAFQEQYGPQAEQFLRLMGVSLNPEKLGLQYAIQDALVQQAFQFLPRISSEEYIQRMMYNFNFIQEQALDLIPFQAFDMKTGHLDMNAIARYQRQFGFTLDDFFMQLSNAVQRYQGIQLVHLAAFVPTFEQRRIYQNNHQLKQFSIAKITLDDFIKKQSQNEIPVDTLQAFYDQQNKKAKRYWVPELRSATIWRLDPQQYSITLSDAEVEEYYKNQKTRLFVETPLQMRVRHIVIALDAKDTKKVEEARTRADQIYQRVLKDPCQFAAIAEQESDDRDSAARSGLLDYFSKNTYEYEFEKAAFLLKNDGNISPIIRTKKGFEILQRVDRKAPTYKSLDAVRDTIQQTLIQKKFQQKATADIKQILAQKGDIDTFLSEKKATTQVVVDQALGDSRIVQQIFKLRLSEAALIHDKQEIMVVRVTDIKKRHLPPLEEIAEKVQKDFITQAAEQDRDAYITSAREQARTTGLAQVVKGWDVTTTPLISKDQFRSITGLQKVPTDLLTSAERVGSTVLFPDSDTVYLIRLDAKEPFMQEKFLAAQSEILAKALPEQIKIGESAFVASLFRHATIKVNESTTQI